jgi:hypothetical protein
MTPCGAALLQAVTLRHLLQVVFVRRLGMVEEASEKLALRRLHQALRYCRSVFMKDSSLTPPATISAVK